MNGLKNTLICLFNVSKYHISHNISNKDLSNKIFLSLFEILFRNPFFLILIHLIFNITIREYNVSAMMIVNFTDMNVNHI